jgi:hypothetical protein
VIDCTPQKIMLGLPCGDHRMYAEMVMSLIGVLAGSGGLIQPFWHNGDSNVCHARNEIAHHFLTATDCDTLFFWDVDIVATMQEFLYVLDGPEQVVIAPYARKEMGREPVGFGMGFCRIHRSVFDTLNEWTNEDGSEALQRYYITGKGIATHFFYTGSSPEARWYGEDTGFWHFCACNDITQRVERRTQLFHLGLHRYGYPNQLAGHAPPYAGAGAYPPQPMESFTEKEIADQAQGLEPF